MVKTMLMASQKENGFILGVKEPWYDSRAQRVRKKDFRKNNCSGVNCPGFVLQGMTVPFMPLLLKQQRTIQNVHCYGPDQHAIRMRRRIRSAIRTDFTKQSCLCM